jgi:hypothetical protein
MVRVVAFLRHPSTVIFFESPQTLDALPFFSVFFFFSFSPPLCSHITPKLICAHTHTPTGVRQEPRTAASY